MPDLITAVAIPLLTLKPRLVANRLLHAASLFEVSGNLYQGRSMLIDDVDLTSIKSNPNVRSRALALIWDQGRILPYMEAICFFAGIDEDRYSEIESIERKGCGQ